MGEKKSKALVNKLIDDLLNEEVTKKSVDAGERPKVKAVEIAPQDTVPLEDDFSRTVRTPTEAIPIPAPSADSTVKLEKPKVSAPKHEGEVRASVGRVAPFRAAGGNSTTEAALAQSENLRIAQQRIFELENEIERLRVQNEEVSSAAETLRRVADEMSSDNERLRGIAKDAQIDAEQEKEILLEGNKAFQREMELLKQKNEELEVRVSTNIQKIRVRERELENRLELVKMEGAALIRAKDEMLLDLKRQVDQLNLELSNYRNKNQELNRNNNDKQEILRRTVKTLRLALSMLEGEEPSSEVQKKAK